jgi:glycosyltransferase involved in cell wall biosynthesis
VADLREQLSGYAAGDGLLDELEPQDEYGRGRIGTNVRGRPPTAEELRSEVIAPGEPALLSIGIIYQGPWKKFADGMGQHVRQQVKALSEAGLPVWLQDMGNSGPSHLDAELQPEVIESVGHLRHVTLSSAPIAIRHFVFNNADELRAAIMPAGARLAGIEAEKSVYAGTIVYTSWERDRISDDCVRVLNRCGQVWVPCMDNLRAFRNSGVDPSKLRRVPYPYDPSSAVCQIPFPRGSETAPSGKRFYTIGKWEPRKNQYAVMQAFFLAFTPQDRASLLIKTHGWGDWDDYPSIDKAMGLCLMDPDIRARGWTPAAANRVVRIIVGKVPDDEIVDLHRKNNIYVSAGSGEAWDIPAFEAACAGNRLVFVGYGGPSDYAAHEDEMVSWDMTAVPSSYGWEPGAQWAKVTPRALAPAMRDATPPTRRVHPPHFNGLYSRRAVGSYMRECVLQLAESLRTDLGSDLLLAGSFG